MQTKLTIRIDDSLVRQGKEWSRTHGVSLSTMISRYLETVERQTAGSSSATPLLQKLKGVLKGKIIPDRSEYIDSLLEKHR